MVICDGREHVRFSGHETRRHNHLIVDPLPEEWRASGKDWEKLEDIKHCIRQERQFGVDHILVVRANPGSTYKRQVPKEFRDMADRVLVIGDLPRGWLDAKETRTFELSRIGPAVPLKELMQFSTRW